MFDYLMTEENVNYYFNTIFPFSKLIKSLNKGSIKLKWHLIRVLIVIFILCYLSYSLQYIITSVDLKHLINNTLLVPIIFFCGSIFVLMVGILAFKTTKDIHNYRILKEESITDFLLGIYNRRFFNKILQEKVNEYKLKSESLSLFLVDIDNFKDINDTYGHLIGDQALIQLAMIIKNHTTSNEIVCRYGGDELVVICQNKNEIETYELANTIRKHIENNYLIEESKMHPAITKTISVGITTLHNLNCMDINCLIDKADSNLYKAKEAGKNRVVY